MVVVWMNLVLQHLREGFFTAELHNWITINIEQPKWSHYWATTVHALWELRKKALHDDYFVMSVKPWEVICSSSNSAGLIATKTALPYRSRSCLFFVCFFCAESISKEGVPNTLEMRPKVANDQYNN
ncbi:hypothetical protein L195_g046781 [Trifolium pratense]|uniref:Uncharacterized protein n=1 Tax=Trifolium pratense TaxID=57577 RepID=A0A2K3K1S0_TRIPR|nr:hypothetical protein L195_g051826 [Trifolium pratense]PNX90656.1 hypothetical protein L195_g046781 [Trifolium pratense]